MRKIDFYSDDNIRLYCDDRDYFQQSLDEVKRAEKASVNVISTIPKSGTWAVHYFLATLEALHAETDVIKPYKHFYEFSSKNNDETVYIGIGHFQSPLKDEEKSAPLLETAYPTVIGYDYFSFLMKSVVGHTNFMEDKAFRVALIYRNPLDQIASYCRGLWNPSQKWEGFEVIVEAENQQAKPISSISQFIHAGGAHAYSYFLKGFLDLHTLYPEQTKLVSYEDTINNRQIAYRELVNHIFDSTEVVIASETLEASIKATNRERIKVFEITRNKNIGCWYEREEDNFNSSDGKIVYHLQSGNSGEWKKSVKEEDTKYVKNKLSQFEIDHDLFDFGQ